MNMINNTSLLLPETQLTDHQLRFVISARIYERCGSAALPAFAIHAAERGFCDETAPILFHLKNAHSPIARFGII